jgi:taurine--2-oxoglutarate transaminase
MFDIPDSEILPLSMEHSFWTWSAQARVAPIPVTHAQGVYFWDASGKRYLDFNSMTMCVNIGHGNEHVINAIIEQAKTLPYAAPEMATKTRRCWENYYLRSRLVISTLHVYLAEQMRMRMPSSLPAASPASIKSSRYRSYHGASAGAMVNGDPRRLPWEPNLMPGVVHFLDPFRYRSTFHRTNPDISEADFSQDYLNHLEEIIQYEGPETIAAILLEPVTGTNGIIIPPEGYLKGVRSLCDTYHILLIADEVMSGFGRTGKWFAVDHWDIVPDLMTMAKGLTSAYAPLGAVAMKPEIAAAYNEVTYQGGLTYTAHPISLAAAIANIQVLQADHLIDHSHQMGFVLHRLLNDLGEQHPSVGEVRSIGLFGIIELVRNRKTKEPLAPWNSSSPEMAALRKSLLAKGLFLYSHWHTLLIIPPSSSLKNSWMEGFAILDAALSTIDQSISGK